MTISRDRRARLRSARGRAVIGTAVAGSAVAAVLIALGGALFAVAYVVALPTRRVGRAARLRAADLRAVRAVRRTTVAVGARTLSGVVIAGALVTAGASTAVAHLDGNANSTVATATPISTGTTYSGTFVGGDDVDHYAFTTTQAGVTVRVTVHNTFGACSPPGANVCPIWGTLVDGDGKQLGGEGSGAGTGPVNAGDTESFDWKLDGAARYVLALDSNGDQPTYDIRVDQLGTGGGGGPGGGGSTGLFGSLGVPSKQRGTVVRGTLAGVLAGGTVRAVVTMTGGTKTVVAGTQTRRDVKAGAVKLSVPLRTTARRVLAGKGKLSVRLTVRVSSGGVAKTATRSVKLLPSR